MDRFEQLNTIASMASVQEPVIAAAATCPQCGYTGTMDKPKKSSMAAADDYSDSYNEVREELNGQLSSRYPSDNFWVSIVDFGTDWVIYRVEDSTYDCTYYQAPYSNTDNGLSIGSPVEVHQVWTPVS